MQKIFTGISSHTEERISAHAQPAVKCELFYMYNLCWAYAERILSHTEHTRNEFHCMLSILGTDFTACWACAEMFKSLISLPIRIRFLKISCYRSLGPHGFGFYKKSIKKISCLCTFKITLIFCIHAMLVFKFLGFLVAEKKKCWMQEFRNTHNFTWPLTIAGFCKRFHGQNRRSRPSQEGYQKDF